MNFLRSRVKILMPSASFYPNVVRFLHTTTRLEKGKTSMKKPGHKVGKSDASSKFLKPVAAVAEAGSAERYIFMIQ